MGLRKKMVGAGLLAGAFVIGAAAPAMAHDCFVVQRSAQGSAGAAHSANWFMIDVNAALAPCATAEQIADVDAALTDAGLPLVFDTRTDKLLKNNDHGIQHLSDTVVPIILDVVGDAAIPCLGD